MKEEFLFFLGENNQTFINSYKCQHKKMRDTWKHLCQQWTKAIIEMRPLLSNSQGLTQPCLTEKMIMVSVILFYSDMNIEAL